MIKITILTVGKFKEPWLQEALDLYIKRLSSQAIIEIELFKDENRLIEALYKKKFPLMLFDAKGKMLTSEGFAKDFFINVEKGGGRLGLVIGGVKGLPRNILSSYPTYSLSKMIFTHQMARVIICEQIYRAFQIKNGSQYHLMES